MQTHPGGMSELMIPQMVIKGQVPARSGAAAYTPPALRMHLPALRVQCGNPTDADKPLGRLDGAPWEHALWRKTE